MWKATKTVWNDNIVQVRVRRDDHNEHDVALGFADQEEPFVFSVTGDAEEIKLNLLRWLRSHILESGGSGPDEGLADIK